MCNRQQIGGEQRRNSRGKRKALSEDREGLSASVSLTRVGCVKSGSALFRRRSKDFPAAWLWLGLRLGCFLGFFLAFVFISHGKKCDTKDGAGKVRGEVP